MNEEVVIRGIDDKRRLLGFFTARGHNSLVLRVADLRELPLPDQAYLVTLMHIWGGLEHPASSREPKDFFHYNARDGYVQVPFAKLLTMDLQIAQELQQILWKYVEGRRAKGEPTRTAADGTLVFCEMSEEELDIARR